MVPALSMNIYDSERCNVITPTCLHVCFLSYTEFANTIYSPVHHFYKICLSFYIKNDVVMVSKKIG